jgi:hypothetical protein
MVNRLTEEEDLKYRKMASNCFGSNCPSRVNNGFNSDFKISSLYNTGHNKCKELLSTNLQFKLDKNPTWPWITNGVSTVEQGLMGHL